MKSYGKASISSRNVSFLFLDPSVNTTGWSMYQVEFDYEAEAKGKNFWKRTLVGYGLLQTPSELTTLEAVLKMHSLFKSLRLVDAAVVEIPEIVYAGKSGQKEILAKAASVIETALAAGVFIAALREAKVEIGTIKPREWQTGNGKPRKVNSKAWAITIANALIGRTGGRPLHTKNDENISDAIVMGEFSIPRIFTQQILFS